MEFADFSALFASIQVETKQYQMYHFKIVKVQEGGYKFELGGIKLLVDDYSLINDQHQLKTPNKAIAFFNIGDDVYGISNESLNLNTAEDLYDTMTRQYKVFISPEQAIENSNLFRRTA